MSAAKDINGITIEGNNINVLAIKGSSIGIFGGKDAQNNKLVLSDTSPSDIIEKLIEKIAYRDYVMDGTPQAEE